LKSTRGSSSRPLTKYDERPQHARFGQWLESLIDGSLKELLQNPDEVQEN
jgi:hypothetical protein